MKISEIKEILDAQVIFGEHLLDNSVNCACGADLMSDVLAFVKDKLVLLTGLTNPQVIRTAEMVDVCVIAFVRGKMPDKETIKLAAENNICLLKTDLTLFEACGKLYKKGLKGK
ncbi:MAG: DRTGG domain-containing protein [Clostridia bacterium]|nr:DRTGG domain-containing protein [Clostridia bacterium]